MKSAVWLNHPRVWSKFKIIKIPQPSGAQWEFYLFRPTWSRIFCLWPFTFLKAYLSPFIIWMNWNQRRVLWVYPAFLIQKCKFLSRYRYMPKLEKTVEGKWNVRFSYILFNDRHHLLPLIFQVIFLSNSLTKRGKLCITFLWYKMLQAVGNFLFTLLLISS